MTQRSVNSARFFQRKVVVVTGAARGIGRASAVALVRAGADIVKIDICAPVQKSFGVEASKSFKMQVKCLRERCRLMKQKPKKISLLKHRLECRGSNREMLQTLLCS